MQILNKQSAKIVYAVFGINCVEGQRTSRIINAICKKYGIDKHAQYNALFAKLSDALNPIQ